MLNLNWLYKQVKYLSCKIRNTVSLDDTGKVPSENLPSYVDDVLEVSSLTSAPATGEKGKIYVTLDSNKTYRWSGTQYVEIPSGTTAWGTISGTIADQTDLKTEFDSLDYPKIISNSGFTMPNNTAIIKDNDGNYGTMRFTSSNSPITLVSRDVSGRIKGSSPVENDDLSTKEYTDAGDAAINFERVVKNSGLDGLHSSCMLCTTTSNTPSLMYYSQNPTSGRLAQFSPAGTLKSAEPTATDDLTTKAYVDSATKSKAEIIVLTSIADPTTASVEDCATQLNAILAALKA